MGESAQEGAPRGASTTDGEYGLGGPVSALAPHTVATHEPSGVGSPTAAFTVTLALAAGGADGA